MGLNFAVHLIANIFLKVLLFVFIFFVSLSFSPLSFLFLGGVVKKERNYDFTETVCLS